MAIEPDLKDLYRGLEADQEEVDRYRERLTLRLNESHIQDVMTPNERSFRPAYLSLVASVFVISLVGVYYFSRPVFPQQSIDELEALIASNDSESLRQQALHYRDGNDLNALNANMILALGADAEQSVGLALRGLQIDRRPEFRREYLELLLDKTEQISIDPSELETVMENENDAVCVALYKLLLKFS